MWEMFLLLLDNSRNEETDSYDFTVLDPPNKSINKHPLMLIASSGQETLLTHETTQKLLSLKWRTIPRLVFYSNILFYLVFITIFCAYSIELTNLTFASANYANNNIDDIWCVYKSIYHYPILTLIVINLIKILIQIITFDGKQSSFQMILTKIN